MKRPGSNYLFALMMILVFSCSHSSTMADDGFDVSVSDPLLKQIKPKICFDESHKNHHKISTTYKPFANLVSNDGCIVSSNEKRITNNILTSNNIYVIATAMGEKDPGDSSPFLQQEIDDLEKWVKEGGSVLIITEHYPFGLAMAGLLNKFGLAVHNGYTEDSILADKKVPDALLFEKSKGYLNKTNPILDKVERLYTFTGSSVKGDTTWTQLLYFSPAAQNFNVKVETRKDGGDIVTNVTYSDFYPAKGYSQAMSREYVKGRIVVLAESALLTAQIDKNGNKFGMNVPGSDNKQFALNVIRWLARR